MTSQEYEALPQVQRDRIQAGVEAIVRPWVVVHVATGAAAWYDLVAAVLEAADGVAPVFQCRAAVLEGGCVL